MAEIPIENREYSGDALTSMLFKSVIDFIEGRTSSALFFIQNINMMFDIRHPMEWECFEFSFFLFMRINNIKPKTKEADFYLKGYKKKLNSYYKINKESIISFYKNSSFKAVRNEVKGSLKRRWNKSWLIRGYAVIDDSRKSRDISEEWYGVVETYLESILLMYVMGNVKIKEIESLEEKAKRIITRNGGLQGLAPFIKFTL